MALSSPDRRDLFLGMFTRRERWGLSWRGWLIVFICILLSASVVFFGIYPVLSVTERVDTKTLVVEGWVHEYAIRAAVDEFRDGRYERVFATGGPVQGSGAYTNDYNTSASVGAELLKKWGIPTESLEMVPSRVMTRDRTYGSAVALRKWFKQHHTVHSMNVLTENVHARRTRLLFAKALGPDVEVGIIAVQNPGYDPQRRWRYSEDVKEIASEALALIYAELLFRPERNDASESESELSKQSATQ